MDEALKAELYSAVDESIKKNLDEIVAPQVAEKVDNAVKQMRLDRLESGKDVTGLSDDQKKEFMTDVRAIARNEKAAHFEYSDQAGGYLVTPDVHDGILRIAATTGLVARDAQKFSVSADELEIPRYTGSVLQGEYLGEDEEGDETAVDLGVARLFVKSWQTIFRLSNNLIADARVDVADWLMSLAAEGLAYRLDREGFAGGTFTGSPFVGLIATASGVPVHTMASGNTGFEDFGIAEASDVIGTVPTSVVPNAAFYFHRTVWAKIRQRATSGVFEFNMTNSNLAGLKKENGLSPVGEILGYPVYTSDVLPAYSTSGTSKVFGVFGDLSKMLAWADKGPMAILKSEHATVGSKSLFRANQVAFRLNHRHGITQLLPTAGVQIKTAAG